MKNIATLILFSIITFSLSAQESRKCHTTDNEQELQRKYPERANAEEFEKWMSEKLKDGTMKSERGVVVLPIVFHLLHKGTPVGSGFNLSQDLIEAQVQQLNDDFRRTPGTAGFNTNPVGADLEIEFCLATVDPDGNVLIEPGIDRIDGDASGFGDPGYGIGQLDNTVKPATIWDPERYVNVWVTPINPAFFGILGYAQFPSVSGLSGLNNNEGPASSDGVVVAPGTVGSISLPNPSPGFGSGAGRVLTHELGHFFGLRHIWGDGGCSADDFCLDTPESNGANSGCQVGSVSCGTVDMVENYMDYSNDECMNIFTQDQKARVDAVLMNSPRRIELLSSNECGGDVAECEDPYPMVSDISSTLTSSGVQLSWAPVGGSIGCQVRAGLASAGFQQTITIFEADAFGFFVPESAIEPNEVYQWQVRCGCSINPLIVGDWSETGFFGFGSGISPNLEGGYSITEKMHLFPNPASGFITVSGVKVERYFIYDINGRLIGSDQFTSSEAQEVRVDISSLETGFYTIAVETGSGSFSRKGFVKN